MALRYMQQVASPRELLREVSAASCLDPSSLHLKILKERLSGYPDPTTKISAEETMGIRRSVFQLLREGYVDWNPVEVGDYKRLKGEVKIVMDAIRDNAPDTHQAKFVRRLLTEAVGRPKRRLSRRATWGLRLEIVTLLTSHDRIEWVMEERGECSGTDVREEREE